jgi:pilus assembly protein CpaB
MQRQQSGGRNRAFVFLAGSLLLAAVAAVLVVRAMQKSAQEVADAAKPKATADVVIAVRDLYMGLPITADDVTVRQVAPEMIPRDDTFAQLTDVLGRTPRERILANESIREERLARPDAGIGLNAIVTPGKRAMTVATDTETAVAGLLQAGNYIDVIVTIAPEDPAAAGAKWVTDTILQGIKVLAVGSALDSEAPRKADGEKVAKEKPNNQTRNLKPSITLELTPEEAERLAQAVARGDIHVVLRSDIDILQTVSNGPVTTDALIGADPAGTSGPRPERPAAPVEPALPKATVIQGGSSSIITFQTDGTTSESTSTSKPKRGR